MKTNNANAVRAPYILGVARVVLKMGGRKMSSRRRFLQTAALTAAALSAATAGTNALASGSASPAKPASAVKPVATPTPSPTPTPTSPVAKALAASLQQDLPAAKISNAMTSQIADDIQGNFVIGKTLRKRKNRQAFPPPDLHFVPEQGQSS